MALVLLIRVTTISFDVQNIVIMVIDVIRMLDKFIVR